jgi:hypothetical protein
MILTALLVFNPLPEYKKVIFHIPFVRICVCMYVRLTIN